MKKNMFSLYQYRDLISASKVHGVGNLHPRQLLRLGNPERGFNDFFRLNHYSFTVNQIDDLGKNFPPKKKWLKKEQCSQAFAICSH